MAYGLPDGLWLPLLIMIVIILALLWKDKISRSSGGGGGGGSTTPTRDEGPSVSMRKRGSSTVGEEFSLRGRYDSGDGSISNYALTMNGRDITGMISTWSNGRFETEPMEVPDVDTVDCEIQVRATYGQADDSIEFNPSSREEPEGPTLEVDVETEDADPGEDNGAVTVTATPIRGDNDVQRTYLQLPDFNREDTSTGSDDVEIRQEGIPAGEYRYRAETTDGVTEPVGKANTFRIRSHHEGELEVVADHDFVDRTEGRVRMWAEVDFSSTDVEYTKIGFRRFEDGGDISPDEFGEDRLRGDIQRGSDRVEVTEDLDPGEWVYIGMAETSADQAIDTGGFEIEGEGGGRDGPGDGHKGTPEFIRVINQNTSNNLGNPGFQNDGEVVNLLEQIFQEVKTSEGDQEATGFAMDAYQLLFALSALQPDLTREDNSEILNKLEMIREAVETGQISPDQVENSVRTGLNEVFGQDLQNGLQNLEVDGLDEQAIVQAIRDDNQVDIDALAERVSNIEQTVDQIQSQLGREHSDTERILEEIKSAIRDTQVDQEQTDRRREAINPVDSDESGGEGNKNQKTGKLYMPDDQVDQFSKQELKSLEEDIEALSEFTNDFDDLNFQDAVELKQNIEEEVAQIQSELEDVAEQAKLVTNLYDDIDNSWSASEGKPKEEIINEIETAHDHENVLRKELQDIHERMRDVRNKVNDLENLCKQNNEILGASADEFSASVKSIAEDMKKLDKLLQVINQHLRGFREESTTHGTQNVDRAEVLGDGPGADV